jgi:hypothetical protein
MAQEDLIDFSISSMLVHEYCESLRFTARELTRTRWAATDTGIDRILDIRVNSSGGFDSVARESARCRGGNDQSEVVGVLNDLERQYCRDARLPGCHHSSATLL